MKLQGKKIIIGITGSIAAYKSAYLVRLLIKEGAEVKVILTDAAKAFISDLTLGVLSKNEVYSDIFSEDTWHNHVELGLWADLMVIAPCTAVTLSKLSNGHSDNMLSTTYLSAKCPIMIAPAMDLDMWKHPSTKKNLKQLQAYGNQIIPVGNGELASGLKGDGRMAEPEDILESICQRLYLNQDFEQKSIVITAGPTYELIDPVRYIGNFSTGKMGICLAETLAQRGAQVHLILGPSSLDISHSNIDLTRVKTAEEMLSAVQELWSRMDVGIFAAAVADYRPLNTAEQKIKKNSDEMTIRLIKNPDIAHTIGQQKTKDQWTVGFALETNNAFDHGLKKLKKKNFDLLVLNSLEDEGAGFGLQTNKVTLIKSKDDFQNFPVKPKEEVAQDIADALSHLMANN